MKDRIAPHFWFTEKAEEAARFYVSIFPDSRIDRVATSPARTWPRLTRCAYDAAAAWT